MSRETNTLAAQRLPQSNDSRQGEPRLGWPLEWGFIVGVVALYAGIGYVLYRAVGGLM